jgi:hypothetical protein
MTVDLWKRENRGRWVNSIVERKLVHGKGSDIKTDCLGRDIAWDRVISILCLTRLRNITMIDIGEISLRIQRVSIFFVNKCHCSILPTSDTVISSEITIAGTSRTFREISIPNGFALIFSIHPRLQCLHRLLTQTIDLISLSLQGRVSIIIFDDFLHCKGCLPRYPFLSERKFEIWIFRDFVKLNSFVSCLTLIQLFRDRCRGRFTFRCLRIDLAGFSFVSLYSPQISVLIIFPKPNLNTRNSKRLGKGSERALFFFWETKSGFVWGLILKMITSRVFDKSG